MQNVIHIATLLWGIGILVMMAYTIVSYIRLHKQIQISVHLRENLWVCDEIHTPFILGLLRTRIYLPSHIEEEKLCSSPRYLISACPVAFGEIGIKERIKSVVAYKKPVGAVFYRTNETDIQKILHEMLTYMIDPLMEDAEGRTFTITKYRLDEVQPLKQINENVWMLDIILGYYAYEGTDLGTMEEVMEHEPQKASDMGGYGIEH